MSLPDEVWDLIFRKAHQLQSKDTWLPDIRHRCLLDDLYLEYSGGVIPHLLATYDHCWDRWVDWDFCVLKVGPDRSRPGADRFLCLSGEADLGYHSHLLLDFLLVPIDEVFVEVSLLTPLQYGGSTPLQYGGSTTTPPPHHLGSLCCHVEVKECRWKLVYNHVFGQVNGGVVYQDLHSPTVFVMIKNALCLMAGVSLVPGFDIHKVKVHNYDGRARRIRHARAILALFDDFTRQ